MSIEDKAQEVELAAWMANNATRKAPRTFSPDEPGYGPAQCDECGMEMPELRRREGRLRCAGCQEVEDQIAKRRACAGRPLPEA